MIDWGREVFIQIPYLFVGPSFDNEENIVGIPSVSSLLDVG